MIKKLLRASAASLFAIALFLSLCSCAGTSESDTQSLVSNPFETSENENSETQASNPFDTTASVTNISVDSAVIETLPPFSKPQDPNLKMMISANIRKPELHSATTALKASQL